ncbi:MAG: 6-bladed beta-propeller [Gemmatimonadales bacterium]
MRRFCPILGATLAGLVGCDTGSPRLGIPTTDTLPGGIVRVTSPAPTAWTGEQGWRFVEDLRINPPDGAPGELINPQSVAVDEAGRIYVADQRPAVIKVFDAEGRFVRTIGRDGEGPGEFRVAYIAAGFGSLVVHDPRLARTSAFDTAGAYLRSWRSACCVWSRIILDQAQRIWIPVSMDAAGTGSRASHLRFTLDGSIIDTVFMPLREEGKGWEIKIESGNTRRTFGTTVPLLARLESTVSPQGLVVHGWSGAYELASGPNGLDTLRIVRRAWTAGPITEARKRQIVEEMIQNSRTWMQGVDTADMRRAFRLEDIPSTAPAFEALAMDLEGNTWVRLGPTESGEDRYDVFDSTGAWLGETVLRLRRAGGPYTVWGNGWIVEAQEDADGRPVIVRLRRQLRRSSR